MCLVPSKLYTAATAAVEEEVKRELGLPDVAEEEAKAAIAAAIIQSVTACAE